MYAVNGVVVELDDPEVRHAGDALRTHRPQLVVRQVPENKLVLEIIFFSVFAANVCTYVAFSCNLFKIRPLTFHCFRGMLGLNLGLSECALLCAS
jgi:hypothetical protein